MTLPVNSRQIDLTSRLLIQQPEAAVTRDRVAILPLVIQSTMQSTMSSPAGRQSTGMAMHPPTASIAAAHAAANEAAGKRGLETVETLLSLNPDLLSRCGLVIRPIRLSYNQIKLEIRAISAHGKSRQQCR